MVNRKLRMLLLSTAFLTAPLWKVKAFDWLPVGDSVSAEGFALTNGVYQEGDRIINTAQNPGEERALRSLSKMSVSEQQKKVTSSGFRVPSVQAFSRGGEVPSVFNTQFEATATDSTLNISGNLNGDPSAPAASLKIDGDVTLTAHEVDMVVNITSDVQIVPYVDPTGNAFGQGGSFTGTGFAQIYFDVAAGRKITVNLDHNLEFKGRTLGAPAARGVKRDGTAVVGDANKSTRGGEEGGPVVPTDMVLTFKGAGQTIFKMADGTSIKFSGDIDGSNSVDVLDGNSFTGFSNNAAGTKVFITMEQTQADVANGLNKVEFQRQSLGTAGDPNSDLRDLILVGNNSIITFVGTDDTGRAHEADTTVGNFASVGFDPSNNGAGRMVLFVLGAYSFGFEEGFPEGTPEFSQIVRKFPFNEGAVVVAGHHVAGYTPEEVRTTLNYSVPAGGQATFRVVDNLVYNNRDAAAPFTPNLNNRNGLLVINDAQSVSKRGSDPYLDFFHNPGGGEEAYGYRAGFSKAFKSFMQKRALNKRVTRAEEGPSQLFGFFWSYSWGVNHIVNSRNVRDGFVLGVNGVLDVYPNTVFDYVAGSVNQVDLLAENDYQAFVDPKGKNIDSLSVLKKKNPAAFVVDGLDQLLFANNISAFQAANPALVAQPVHARINLRGDGQALFRAAGSSKENIGYIYNFWRLIFPVTGVGEGEEGAVISPLDDATLNYNEALLLGDGTFDGYRLSANDDTRDKGEGEHVLEVEGPLSVVGLSSSSVVDPLTGQPRNYATGSVFVNTGSLQMLSTEVDGRGFEVAARPLSVNQVVRRYNSPAFFFNNNAAFMNSVFAHNDLSKLVDGSPVTSDPAVTGGERFAFADKLFTYDGLDHDRYRLPEIQFYNAALELHESLNLAGVRIVVKDIPSTLGGAAVSGQAGNNSSVVRFFDHGPVDNDFRGFGRVFMLGSFNNVMADDSTNWVTESAYANIFKHNALSTNPADVSASAALSLQNGNEFPADVNLANADKLRAQHLFLVSGMEKGTTNVALGWSTPFGVTNDAYPYDNTFYANPAVVEVPSTNDSEHFTVDAFVTPPATLAINGSYINFSGFNKEGKSVKGPLTRSNNQGIVYVRHGGKITIGNNVVSGVQSVPAQAVIDTVIGQKVRNDYNDEGNTRTRQLAGIVDLPRDQALFAAGAGVQSYGFTQEVLNERADQTSGYFRLSFENVNRDKYDRSGAGDVEISWFNREGDNQVFDAQANQAKAANAVKSLTKNAQAKFKTRATEAVSSPVAKPGVLLYIGSNDDINQLAVAGATLADRFILDVSGDAVSPAFGRVREFVSIKRSLDLPTDHMNGEGAHAQLFVEFGGRIGLGTRHYNERSNAAWSILGKDFVQIVPMGDGTIDVNSNLLISDKQALLAGQFFGVEGSHRLTFFAENESEIRIPAGGELDLSSFGQSANLQTIAFAGKAKLVVETGATIRFPQPSSNGPGLALLFTDDSQLIFEGAINPEVFSTAFADSAAANVERIKLIGNAQIRGNKNGKIQVLGSVLVGVQSDAQTPITNVSISLQRDSQFNIGTPTLAGGAFEVGNPAPVAGGLVNFSLVNFRGNPIIHIDREGFLGLGAGVINKHDNPNGDAERANNPVLAGGVAALDANGFPIFTPETSNVTGWEIQPLNNVGTITIQLNSGSFEHNNIVDGSDGAASLIAVGPATAYNFRLSGPADVAVRGGGNVMLVPAGVGLVRANVWDFASPNADGTQYSILPSGPLFIDRGVATDLNAPTFGNGGFAFAFATQADFFSFVGFNPLQNQTNKKADLGRGSFGASSALVAGFINANANAADIYPAATNKVVRLASPQIAAPGTADQALDSGALTARDDGAIDPTVFSPISQ